MSSRKYKSRLTLSVFELFFLAWSGLVLLSVTLAILGIFYPIIPGIYLSVSIFTIWRLQSKKNTRKDSPCPLAGKIKILKVTPLEKFIFIGLAVFTIVLSSFTVPTIFGGRDEGSISTSALMINKDHGLKHQSKLINTFGKIYGEGKALNFPGFFYQKSDATFLLKSQFLPGYSAYLANFAYSNNIALLKFANALPLIIFLTAFYLVTKQLTSSNKLSLLSLLLLLTITPLVLFYKFTLSEIFFASLIWSSLYFLIKYLKLKKDDEKQNDSLKLIYFWFIFIPLLPTVFIRIESFGIIFILMLILILQSHKELQLPKFQTPIFLLIFLAVLSIVLFNSFFIATTKGFAESLISAGQSNATVSSGKSFIPKMWKNFYILKLFYTYNLLPIIFLGTMSMVKLIKHKKWDLLTPLFFLGITLIYLIDANISLDHPWMLRRFIFSIIPLMVLYTIIFFQQYPLRNKIINYAILTILITSNILLSIPFASFHQNNDLLMETNKLAAHFKNNDLILVSQKASGSGWSLISEPLRTIFNKQAVYFFNPNDYNKIDKNEYDNIYLITSQEENAHYASLIKNSQNNIPYSISNQIIEPSKDPLHFPNFIQTKTNGIIYQLK